MINNQVKKIFEFLFYVHLLILHSPIPVPMQSRDWPPRPETQYGSNSPPAVLYSHRIHDFPAPARRIQGSLAN